MGGTQQAPTPYQPANQPGADAAFQSGTGQLAQAGSNLYNSVAPQLSQISSNIANNPYYAQALQGAQGAASQATGQVAPQQFAGAAQDTGVANLAALAGPQYANAATQAGQTGYSQAQALMPQATAGASLAPQVFNQAQSMIPSATQGAQIAPSVLQGLAGAGIQTYGQDQQALANLGTTGLQAGNQVLQTGFDPQKALYNQQFQQQQDQQQALNAMNGVAGSPYAAGVTGNQDQNFNINWQNAQLGRQVQALGAYDQAASTYAGDTSNLTSAAMNNLTSGVNSGVSDYNSLVSGAVNNLATLQNTGVNNFNSLTSGATSNAANLISTGSNALNSGINTGVAALGTLGNQTLAANQASSDLGTAGLNTLAGAAQLPSDIYTQQQQAELAALQAQIAGTNSSTALTQQAVTDQGNYLNIGQTASQGAINAATANNQASAAQMAGFGNLFGGIVGMFGFGGGLGSAASAAGSGVSSSTQAAMNASGALG